MCTLRSLCCSRFGISTAVFAAQEHVIDWQFNFLNRRGSSRLLEQPQDESGNNGERTICNGDDDLRLVRELQSGNADALTTLFEKYSGGIFRLARRILQNSGEAEEVVQQTFIDTYRGIHQFDPRKASYKTWLFHSAYLRTINRKKHLDAKAFYSSVELDEQALMTELYEGAGRLVQQLSSEETVQLVRQLLGSKSIQRRERSAIALTFFHGLTAQEIADRTGSSPAAVRHHLYRGLAKLRSLLIESNKQKSGSTINTERMLVVDPAQLL